MPRLDFEKKFAQQLRDRELKPSAETWEKLQGRLEQQEKGSLRYWWLGIAASLIGAFIVFEVLSSGPKIQGPEIVENPQELKEESGVKSSEVQPIVLEETGETSDQGQQFGQSEAFSGLPGNATRTGVANAGISEKTSIKGEESFERIAQPVAADDGLAEVLEEATAKHLITDQEIELLLEKAMAEVALESEGEASFSDSEVDLLLAEAMAAVKQEQQLLPKYDLTAEALLAEAETELEHSFRAQVFEIIKDGLRKTRNAVANINE